MKKWLLLIICLSALQIGYRITPVLADTKEDAAAIKKVIENYTIAIEKQDVNSVMRNISFNYLETRPNGEMIDYAKFKSVLEEKLKGNINLKITTLKIQGDNATAQVMLERFGGIRLAFYFVKEDGAWKIVGKNALP